MTGLVCECGPALFVRGGGTYMDRQKIELPDIPGIVLTEKQEYDITQVIATMRLSGFPMDGEEIKNLMLLASGAKTAEERIKELDKKYGDG
mgnify:CR=1 FL=1